jgi:hypothetical protein
MELRSALVAASIAPLLAGCAFQFSRGDALTVCGPAYVRESRALDREGKRAARLVVVESIGLGPAAASHRAGLSAGYVTDLWIDVYAFDAVTDRLDAWVRELLAPPEGDPDHRRSAYVSLLIRSFPPAPDARPLARVRGVRQAGAAIGLLETGFQLAAGYSGTAWLSGDADAEGVAFALSEDESQVVLIPTGKE